jgi:protocatechuate 3,4-dioxygenase beta subunit
LVLSVLATVIAKAQTEQTASISGRVMMNGAPARGVKVSLVPGPYGSPETPGRQSARTDDEGRYEFTGLAAGRYGVLAASYVNVSDEFWNSETKPFKLCTVAAGEKLEHQDIRLVRGGVITGRVTDANGNPVINERVSLSSVDTNGKQQAFPINLNAEMFLTDDRGVYRYFGLPPGRYLVSVGQETGGGSVSESNRGFYRRVFYPGVTDAARAELVEVKEGGEATDIDFKLGQREKTFTISGRVVDASGQPVPGSDVSVSLFDKAANRWRVWTSGRPVNDRAEFNYAGWPPGQYGLSSMPNAVRNDYSDLVVAEVKDKDIEDLEIKLQRGAIISGTVAVEGAADPIAALSEAKVFLRAISLEANNFSESLTAARPQPNGGFELKAMPPGKLRLEVISENNKLQLARIERRGAPLAEAFDLKPAEQISGVRVVLTAVAGALRGRLLLPGALPDGWQISVKARRVDSGDLLEQTAKLDASLNFVLQLAAGEYEIIVTLTSRNPGDAAIEAARRRVSISSGSTTEVTLPIELKR